MVRPGARRYTRRTAGSRVALDGTRRRHARNLRSPCPPSAPGKRSATAAEPLVMVTAYDAPGARLVADGGADLLLVGDSVAMVVLGYDDTLQVTVDDMAHHTAAVARASRRGRRPRGPGGRSSSATCPG